MKHFSKHLFYNVLLVLTFVIYLKPTAYSQDLPENQYPQAERAIVGMHLMNIYNIDINQHTFYADFYVWFKWKGQRNPTSIEFVNAVEKWGFTQKFFHEEPIQLEDGYFYNGMRIEGRFYHPFDLLDFPLDKHHLDIKIENTQYPIDSLVYVADEDKDLIREHFMLPGWDIAGVETQVESNLYKTNFGENKGKASTYSDFNFKLSIARPVNYFLFKLFLPLFIVIVISLGSLFIHPAQIESRLSLAIGGLLASVFLQQSYSDALPDVGYMVLMDKIYLIVYALISGTMLRVVLAGNQIVRLGTEANIPAIKKRDIWLSLLFFCLLVLGILILV